MNELTCHVFHRKDTANRGYDCIFDAEYTECVLRKSYDADNCSKFIRAIIARISTLIFMTV